MEEREEHIPVRVLVSDDAMRATLRIEAGADRREVDTAYCINALRDGGVSIDAEAERRINELLALVDSAPGEAHEGVVAEGVAPKHAQDGRFEFAEGVCADPRYEAEDPGDSGDSGGCDGASVDYYAQSSFMIVQTGRLIGRVIPPTDGEDGRNALGRTLAARSGKLCDMEIGEGLSLGDGGEVRAERDGVLRRDKRSLQVLETLEVKESVDFSTGNIRFPGDVTIRKGVRDKFVVEADGTVTVNGLVEAATLRTGRDLHLMGGMSAREKGRIEVGRDLQARYLGTVTGVVGRNAVVEREMVDCDLEVRGDMRSERCVVIGGRLCVTGVCELGDAGGQSGAPTEIVLGRLTPAERKRQRAQRLRSNLVSRIQRLETEQQQITANAPKPSGQQAARLEAIRAQVGSLQGLCRRVDEAVERLGDVVKGFLATELIVRRSIKQGVRVLMGGFEVKFTRDQKGPLRLYIDGKGRPHARDLVSEQAIDLSLCAAISLRRWTPDNEGKRGDGGAREAA